MEIEELKSQLESEVETLDDFRHSKEFLALDRAEQVLINRQSVVMHGLVEVLNERINFRKQTRS